MNVELELQGAIFAALQDDAAVTALVGGRIYDIVPPDRIFPYVSFGPVDSVEDDSECIEGLEVAQQMDVWSRAVGYPECKRIVDAVRAALHDVDLTLPSNGLVYFQCRQTRIFRDPDGLTSHGALSFEASVERA